MFQEVPMTTREQFGTLVSLTDSDLTVADPKADVRGRDVLDRNGEKIGDVDDLLIDDRENRVRFLRVGHGGILGIGEKHFLVPVDAITKIDEDHVHIDRERKNFSGVPGYDPKLAEDPAYYGSVYDWWGLGPYWGPGYVYPGVVM
jgi:sporulation protein YlmC with PRC-barrel domain